MKKIILSIFLVFLLLNYAAGEVLDVTKEGISQELVKNKVLELRVVESSSLTVGNPIEESFEVHKFKAANIDEAFVNLTVDKGNSYKISNGQTKKIDVDGDEIFDVSVEVKSIRQKTVATLVFKLLDAGAAVKEVKKVYEEEGETIIEDTSNLSEVQELQKKLAGDFTGTEEKQEVSEGLGVSFFAGNGSVGLGLLIAITAGVIIFMLIIGYVIYRKFTE